MKRVSEERQVYIRLRLLCAIETFITSVGRRGNGRKVEKTCRDLHRAGGEGDVPRKGCRTTTPRRGYTRPYNTPLNGFITLSCRVPHSHGRSIKDRLLNRHIMRLLRSRFSTRYYFHRSYSHNIVIAICVESTVSFKRFFLNEICWFSHGFFFFFVLI